MNTMSQKTILNHFVRMYCWLIISILHYTSFLQTHHLRFLRLPIHRKFQNCRNNRQNCVRNLNHSVHEAKVRIEIPRYIETFKIQWEHTKTNYISSRDVRYEKMNKYLIPFTEWIDFKHQNDHFKLKTSLSKKKLSAIVRNWKWNN